MSDLKLVTYTGSLVTPQDDALMNNAELVANGMFYGGEVTVKDSTTLHITQGEGHIYGREFVIDTQDLSVGLASSGELNGRVYVHIDLGNSSNPCELLVVTATELPELEDNPDININNGSTDMEICTFKVNTNTVAGVVETVNRNVSVNTLKHLDNELHIDEGKPLHPVIGGANTYVYMHARNEDEETVEGFYMFRTANDTPQAHISPRNLYIGSSDIGKIDIDSSIWMRTRNNEVRQVLKAYGGDSGGIGVQIGGGGATVIGGGEAAQNIINNNVDSSQDGASEQLYLASDNNINLYSNCQTIANRKKAVFSTGGSLSIPNDIGINSDSGTTTWLKAYFKDMIKVQEYRLDNQTINTGASLTPTWSVTPPAGYKFLDVVNIGTIGASNNPTGQTWIITPSAWLDSNKTKIYLVARNLGTTNAKVQFIAHIACIKNTFG